jgi:Leucine-rich repeat (LRR) protein
MENLDSLTNLTWLDLSFNNIAVIEGVQIVGAQNLLSRSLYSVCTFCNRLLRAWLLARSFGEQGV